MLPLNLKKGPQKTYRVWLWSTDSSGFNLQDRAQKGEFVKQVLGLD